MTDIPSPHPLISAKQREEQGFEWLLAGDESADKVFAQWRMVGDGMFSLRDGCLVAQPGDDIGLLYYAARQFDNFLLRLNFLLPNPRGCDNDNSGVYLRFRDPLAPIPPATLRTEESDNLATGPVDTGYEVQIDELSRGDSRKNEADGHFYNRTGAIYKVTGAGRSPGQQHFTNHQQLAPWVWHDYEIRVKDRTYTVYLNGAHATTFTADPNAPGEAFRGRKSCEDRHSGFIGLQTHTGNVAFANVRIKDI